MGEERRREKRNLTPQWGPTRQLWSQLAPPDQLVAREEACHVVRMNLFPSCHDVVSQRCHDVVLSQRCNPPMLRNLINLTLEVGEERRREKRTMTLKKMELASYVLPIRGAVNAVMRTYVRRRGSGGHSSRSAAR